MSSWSRCRRSRPAGGSRRARTRCRRPRLCELAERVERHHAAVLDAEPPGPVFARHVPDVGGSAVRLHLQQFLEVDRLALGLQLFGSFLGGVHQRLRRRWHAPPRRGEFAAINPVAHDRRLVVREDARHRRKVADVSVDHPEQRDDGGLVGRDRVQIMPTSA
jgi:hypothetical protein